MRGKKGISHIGNRQHNDRNLSPSLSVISLNVRGLNSPIKRLELAEWIKTHDPTACGL